MVASLTHLIQDSPGGFWREEGAKEDPFPFSFPFLKFTGEGDSRNRRKQYQNPESLVGPHKQVAPLTSSLGSIWTIDRSIINELLRESPLEVCESRRYRSKLSSPLRTGTLSPSPATRGRDKLVLGDWRQWQPRVPGTLAAAGLAPGSEASL